MAGMDSSDIAATVDGAEADNRSMRAAERKRLRQAMLGQALRIGALLLVILVTALLALRVGVPVDFDSRGRVELVIALLMAWAWLLHRAPGRWLAARRDLQTDRVDIARGRSHLSYRRGFGLIQMNHPVLIVGSHDFDLDTELQRRALACDPVQVRFAPRSHILLDIAPLDISPAEAPPAMQDWSDRDRALLAQLALGRSDKLIARHLDLSPATVRTYNSALFRKLGVSSRRQAVERARALGLLAVN